MPELVSMKIVGGVAHLTLDSPHNRNALSHALVGQLEERLGEALADHAARVIVLSGTGSVFCSGADLHERREEAASETSRPGGPDEGPRRMVRVLERLSHSPKPVVARVNGAARAGGLGLIGAADIAVAPLDATFGFSEVRLGVVPAVIAVTILPRVRPRDALELFLTGETFDATRASQIGLLTRAVPGDRLDEEVERIVAMLLLGAPGALAAAKHVIATVPTLPTGIAFERMLDLSLARFGSAEGQEGMCALLEKRRPEWAVEGRRERG